jgi:hypothetical protein
MHDATTRKLQLGGYKMEWIVTRLKEGSTWAGLAGIIAGASFIPHAAEISHLIPSLGVVVAGVLAIWFP